MGKRREGMCLGLEDGWYGSNARQSRDVEVLLRERMRGTCWHVRKCFRIRSPRMSTILTPEERRMGSSNGTICARKQPRRVFKLRSRKQLPSNFGRMGILIKYWVKCGASILHRSHRSDPHGFSQ